MTGCADWRQARRDGANPRGLQVITEPVGLDIELDKGAAAPADFFGLAGGKTTSAAFQIDKRIADLGGLDRLAESKGRSGAHGDAWRA